MCPLLFNLALVLALFSVTLASSKRIPDRVDWRDVPGVISEVRDQGPNCTAGWAFAAAAALEASMKLVYGLTPKVLSPQSLIDCDRSNFGCFGGTAGDAIAYLSIATEKDYPYKGVTNHCRTNKTKEVIPYKPRAFVYKIAGKRLKVELATKGPFVAMIDASRESFKKYKSGIYHDPDCKDSLNKLNHGILVIGYGTHPKHGDYWLLKNSWGKDWGENGYMRMSQKNPCGLYEDLATLWKYEPSLKGKIKVAKHST